MTTRWPSWSEVTDKPGSFYTLPLAANGTRGGIQIGFTTSAANRNYAVQLSSEKAYVNVPWTDHYDWSDITNKPSTFPPSAHTHPYVAIAGDTMTGALTFPKLIYNWQRSENVPMIALKGAEEFGIWYYEGNPDKMKFSANGDADSDNCDFRIDGGAGLYHRGNLILDVGNLGYSSSGKNYAVQKDSSNNLYVNVPWTDNNTTYNFTGVQFNSGNSSNRHHDCNDATENGHYYYNANGPSTTLGATTEDGALYVQSYSSSWVGQIAQDYRNGHLFVRSRSNGTWQSWKRIIDTDNIGSQSVNYATSAGTAGTATYAGSDVEGTCAVNSNYCTGTVSYKGIKIRSNRRLVTVVWDITFKSSYSSDNVAIISDVCPVPWTGGTVAVCSGTSVAMGNLGLVCIDAGRLRPWYCGTVSGHWIGTISYVTATE